MLGMMSQREQVPETTSEMSTDDDVLSWVSVIVGNVG
jgi:hypothetical protein